jgi:CRISPR-associated protein Cst1
MEQEQFKIGMGTWLQNASLIGFYSTLGEKLKISGDEIIIEPEMLEDFENRYFNFIINKYVSTLSWKKIVEYEETVKKHLEEDFANFKDNDLEGLNKYIENILKKYMKSNSYSSAYPLISGEVNPQELEKSIAKINLKKSETLQDRIPEIKETFKKIQKVIEYFNVPDAKKYIRAKNVIYTFIKNGWTNVSFLNRTPGNADMYIDYRDYFVTPAKEYLEADKSKYKYNCSWCGHKMKDLKNDISFLNYMGFDVARKSSHVWDFNNDIAICPVCKLIYSCLPLGFNYTTTKGIFVNANHSLEDLYKVNYNMSVELLGHGTDKVLTYKALNDSIVKSQNEKFKNQFVDVQVINYEDEKYRFNILSKLQLKLLMDSKETLDNLLDKWFKEGDHYTNLYEDVVKRIFNGQNMYSLLHKLLYYKITNAGGVQTHYLSKDITGILKINYNFLKEVGAVEKNEEKIIATSKAAGYYLRKSFKEKDAENKLNGICYKILNALKTNNTDSFMDTLLNCYLYVGDAVPKIFTDILIDENNFKTIGYAFMNGLIGERENKNSKGNEGGVE